MLLAFTFILLTIGVGILVSIYSIFLPFINTLGEIGDFNTAYYGAIASVERAELVLKNRGPGFQGSGGYVSGTNRGPQSDYKTGAFAFININPNGMRRTITSRTNRIPAAGEGNVEYLLADAGSTDYNMLNYITAEKILLSYDNTTATSSYYSGGENLIYYNNSTITGTLRLPPKVRSGFGNSTLCTSCDADQDRLGDDIVVDRSLEGYRTGMYFKILPNLSILYYSGSFIDTSKDIAFRESVINATGNLFFGQSNPNGYNPLDNYNNNLSGHVVIAQNPSTVETAPFSTILGNNTTYTGLALNLGLINLLIATNGSIYPFLEYQLTLGTPVADRFYTIQGNSRVGDYDVQVIVKKPTTQGSIAGSFTVIF